MPLIGNTKTYDLTSVLQFLSDNRYSGSLFIYPEGSGEKEVFYLIEGNIKVPYNESGDPIFEADAVFIPPDFPERDEEEQRKFMGETRVAAEEALYERFNWTLKYRFERDLVPEEIRTGEYPSVTLPTGSALMEASRRVDDLLRVREELPQEDVLYEFTGELKEKDDEEILAYVDGSRDLDQIIQDSGHYRYPVYMQVAKIVREDRGRQLEPPQYIDKLRELFEKKKLRSVIQLYLHILNLKDPIKREEAAEILFSDPSLWQSEESHRAFRGSMEGNAFTFLLKSIISVCRNLVFRIKYNGKKLTIALGQDNLKIYEPGVDHGKMTLLSLSSKASIPAHISKALRETAPFTVEDIHSVITNAGVELSMNWETFLVNRVIDLLAPLYTHKVKIDVSEYESYNFPSDIPFEITFDPPQNRDMLMMLIDQWVSVRDDAPPDLAIYTCSKKARELIKKKEEDPMVKFLNMFRRNRRPFAELYDAVKDQIGASEFYFKTVAQIAALNLRPLTSQELKQLIKTSEMEEDHERALRIIRSAEEMGYDDDFFTETREDIRLRTRSMDEGDRLVGDLKSFSLAEVLQSFVTNQQTGTLKITSSHADQEIYFYRGEVSILKRDEVADEDTLATFVSDSALEGLDFFGSQEEEMDEAALNQELAQHVQEEIYEIFLWDDAEFTFILDALPHDFFSEEEHITKLNLNTMSFLMGAVSRLEEWAEISEVIPSENAIFKFASPEYKQQAMASGMDVQLLYLIDGSHNVEDLIRICGKGKFDVCSILYDLYQAGYIVSLDVNELIQRGREAYERKDYGTSRKFYSYAAQLNPHDPRIRKIVDGLTRRISSHKKM